jgi:hypothetical protein
MSASVIVGYALVGLAVWSIARAVHNVLIAHRSRTWQLAVTIAGLGLGTGPAIDGRPIGYAAVAAGALASASLVADAAERGGWSIPRPHVHRRRSAAIAAVTSGALTELDQAAFHLTAVRVAHARLLRAAAIGDLQGAQSAAAAISEAAGQMRDALAVVVEERTLLDAWTG